MSAGFWDRLFDWLERVVPTALASLVAGYKIGTKEINKIQAEKTELEIRLNEKELEEKVNRRNSGRTDRDVMDDAINSERNKK